MIRLQILILFSALSTACASYVQIQPAQRENVTYYSGAPIITSEGENSVVFLTPSDVTVEDSSRLNFYVSVQNIG